MRKNVVLLSLGLGLTACGGGADTDAVAIPTVVQTSTTLISAAPETTATVPETTTTAEPEPTTTAPPETDPPETEPEETVPEETTTTEATSDEFALDADVFVDPDGDYQIAVPGSWETTTEAVPEGIEAWFVGEAENGFRPNVNILTTPGANIELDDYTELGIDSLESTLDNFVLIDEKIVSGDKGVPLAVIEVTGSDLHFVQYTFIEDGVAVILTLTSTTERFADIHAEAEPYLLSLNPVGL